MRKNFIARFLQRGPWLFTLCFVVLPNLPYVVMSLFVTPHRIVMIPLYVLVGIMAIRVPLWASAFLIAGVAVLDVILVISGIFNLAPSLVFDSIQYADFLGLGGSGLYLSLAVILFSTVALCLWLIGQYHSEMRRASMNPALILGACVVVFDATMNFETKNKFGFFFQNAAPFDSALSQLHGDEFNDVSQRNNLLIVLVEGMGAFANPQHTELLAQHLRTPSVLMKYQFRQGTSRYLGSTTSATIRELCGRWGDYRDYRDGATSDCLPARLAPLGFDTYAVHGFTGAFFDRLAWYPKLGFQNLLFAEELVAEGGAFSTNRCGPVFRGLCDRDVAEKVHRLMTKPGDTGRFVYWVTLNSHMPFDPNDATQRFDCSDGGPFGETSVCFLAQMWIDIIAQTVRIAIDANLPSTEIIIVGDHHTPLFNRGARDLFRTGEVTWFSLIPRNQNGS